MGEKKLLLVDGFSIIHRAFYGVPDLTNQNGLHTNAIFGFLNILFKVLGEEQADYLAIAFDVSAPTFRHQMYAAYKGTRKPMPDELREQIPVLRALLSAMGICTVEQAGFEADDIIGTLAAQGEAAGLLVTVVSGDRDLLQLAAERVKIRIPKTKKTGTEVEDYLRQDVLEKYGIEPPKIVDLKGLMGDASDNIPGVPGIGEKTALKILTAFGSLENAYVHIEEVRPNRARENFRSYIGQARLSYQLAKIKTDCPLDFQLEQAVLGDIYTQEAYALLKEMGFQSMLSKFSKNKVPEQLDEGRLKKTERLSGWQAFLKEMQAFAKNQPRLAVSLVFYGKSRKARAAGEDADGQLLLPCAAASAVSGESLGLAASYAGMQGAGSFSRWEGGCFFLSEREEDQRQACLLFSSALSEMGEAEVVTGQLKDQLHNFRRFFPEDFIRRIRDVAIAAYLCDPLASSYSAEELAGRLLSADFPPYQGLFGKDRVEKSLGREEFPLYAGRQAAVFSICWKILKEKMEQYQMLPLFFEIEMPLLHILYDMEERGVRVNKEALASYGARLQERLVSLEQEIYGQAGEPFNINSPKQLGLILFDQMKLPGGKKTKTGYSTSADVLERLQKELKTENPEAFSFLSNILEYRQLAKLKSTYADGLAPFIAADGRIHGSFHQTVAATGRLSSAEPNLQNIPIRMELGRQIRKVFIPREGWLFLDADYSQIELRVLAHLSGDEKLLAAYRQDEDIHRITASEVFHIPLAEVTEAQRRNAKAVNFGIVYGISSFGLGQGLDISRKEAEAFIQRYFETYPKVKVYLDGLVASARKKGYVESLFHRIRPVPELKSSNYTQRSFGERAAMNAPVQGTAADIMKIAMIRVEERLKRENLESVLLLQIHDELLVETKPEEKEAVRRILQEEMEQAVACSVPLLAEVQEGTNWMEAH